MDAAFKYSQEEVEHEVNRLFKEYQIRNKELTLDELSLLGNRIYKFSYWKSIIAIDNLLNPYENGLNKTKREDDIPPLHLRYTLYAFVGE